MVCGHGSGRVRGLQVVDVLEECAWLGKDIEVGNLGGCRGNAAPVREQVTNRDPVLPTPPKLRNERCDGFIDVQCVALSEQVHEHRGDGFRAREEVEQRLGSREHALGVRRIARSVSARVSDRAVEDDLSAPTNAEPEGRVKARLVEVDDARPDRLDGTRVEADVTRRDFLCPPTRHFARREHPSSPGPDAAWLKTLHFILVAQSLGKTPKDSSPRRLIQLT